MAIVYSYPLNNNIKPFDELVGTTEQSINGQSRTVTRNFQLQSLINFFSVSGLQKTLYLTTNNTSGAATFDPLTGILNIPNYSTGSLITPAALTKVNDTNVTLTLGGLPNTALLQNTSLTLGWTGTLADSRITSAATWNAKQNAITTGTNLQYLRGDLSLATFPTNVSSFTNDSGYITNSALIPYITSVTAAATYEPKLGNPSTTGYVLSSTTTGVRSWVAQTGGGGSQDLQSVIDNGSIADNANVFLSSEGSNTLTLSGGAGGTGTLLVYGSSEINGTAINAQGGLGLALFATSFDGDEETDKNVDVASFVNNTLRETEFLYDCSAINVNTLDADGIRVYTDSGIGTAINQGLLGKGLVINGGASSVGNPIEFNKNGVNKARVNQAGELTAQKLIKDGGTSSQILAVDGSVITAGTNITISGGTISAAGGGGSGGILHANASGTDTYTAIVSGVTTYSDGDAYLIRFTNGNTTGATLNINSLGARTLYRNNDGPLIGGDIQSGGEMLCVYNSTLSTFQCIGTSPNSLISYITNADSVTITKGQPVYALGGTGDRITVKLAYNTSDATSAQTVGLVLSTSIAANQKGFIIMQGLLDGLSILPTATWADGDPVYLGATAGTLTKVKQFAPNHLVYLGFVTTASNGSAGRLYVRVQNGYELDELHNVQAQTPANKDTLYYDNTVTPKQWKTASISSILGYTPAVNNEVVTLAGNQTITGTKSFNTTDINGININTIGDELSPFGLSITTSTAGGGVPIALKVNGAGSDNVTAQIISNADNTALSVTGGLVGVNVSGLEYGVLATGDTGVYGTGPYTGGTFYSASGYGVEATSPNGIGGVFTGLIGSQFNTYNNGTGIEIDITGVNKTGLLINTTTSSSGYPFKLVRDTTLIASINNIGTLSIQSSGSTGASFQGVAVGVSSASSNSGSGIAYSAEVESGQIGYYGYSSTSNAKGVLVEFDDGGSGSAFLGYAWDNGTETTTLRSSIDYVGNAVFKTVSIGGTSSQYLMANGTTTTNTWVDYSTTSTIVGWTTFTQKTIRYLVVGKILTVQYYIAGTSNSATTSFTIPQTSTNITGMIWSNNNQSQNNAISYMGYANIPNASSTISFGYYPTGASITSTWTASGTKYIRGTITIELP